MARVLARSAVAGGEPMKPKNPLKAPGCIRNKKAFAKWAQQNPQERKKIEARYKAQKV